ncbi:hypothetical protein DFH07DRAFT_751670 [Mycena maculata]|uniref:Uncharacterized protein n=1 Tax=Mycena maculata TaxID=230809 RepID=A0AAD7IDQ9_9AGAR|nr:hypothetical protein DFH07DRAFT_751670 [Mycena maculata]
MSRKSDHRRKLWSAVIILLYSCATIHSSISWESLVIAFQNYGTSPDLLNALIHPSLKLKILSLVASFLGFLLADTVMVWRCWIVWGRSWVVIVFPVLAAIAGTVCAALGLAGQITVASIENSTSDMRLAPLVRFSTPFLSLSLAVTLYTTGLIAWRIIHVQRYAQTHGVKEVGSVFSPVLELLIESSALYAASLFVFVVLLAMKNSNQNYLQNIHVQITGIAPTLLIFRISIGHTRKDEEWSSPNSELKFTSTVEASTMDGPVHCPGLAEVEGNSVVCGYMTGTSSNTVDAVEKAGSYSKENLG